MVKTAATQVTDIGHLPADWDVVSLADIGTSHSGLTYKPEHVSEEGCLVLRASNIQEGQLKFEDNVFVDMDVPAEVLVQPGDLLICVRNGSRRLIGKAAQIGDNAAGMAFGAFMSVFRSPDNDFVTHAFQSEATVRQIRAELGATINQITHRTLKAITIPWPPAGERAAIAQALSNTDVFLRSLEVLLKKKRDVKQAAMQQLLNGRTRLPGFHGEWLERRIGEFTQVTAGGTPSTSVARYWGGDVRWMVSGEIHKKRVSDVEGRITVDGLRESAAQLLPPGCVLVALAGQGKTRGTVAVSRVDLSTNQSIAGILPSSSHDSDFLYYNLDSRYEELRGESSGDGGRGGLNLSIIKSLSVPMPPKDEQTAIASVLGDMDDELELLEGQLSKCRYLKEGMMQQLLTGRTRLAGAKGGPA